MKTLFTFAFLPFVVSSLHAQSGFWSPSQGGNGHYYELIKSSNTITWSQAFNSAVSRGGYLATITSASENAFVANLAFPSEPWIGGYQQIGSAEPSAGWSWVTGEPFTYTSWYAGEPNEYPLSGATEDSLRLYTEAGRFGTWADLPNQPPGFVWVYDHVVEYETRPQSFRNLPLQAPVKPTAQFLPDRSPTATGLVIVTHGWRDSAASTDSWARQLADSIDQSVGSDWDVVAYDWGADAGSLTSGPELARKNAQQLGLQLGQEIFSKGYTDIHLIGHSAGSWLIDSATDILEGPGITVVNTFLDAYAPGFTSIQLGDSATWAEQFYHDGLLPYTQERLQNAYNVDITALNENNEDGHGWPISWYASTVQDPNDPAAGGWGFARSLELNNLPSHSVYARGDLRVLGESVPFGNVTTPATLFPTTDFLNTDNITSDTGNVNVNGFSFSLTTGSPVWINSVIDVQEAFNMFSFSYEFLSDASGLLSVFLDGNLILLIDEQYANGGLQTESFWLGSDFSAGWHDISFRLDPYNDLQSSMLISDVAFGVIPEPSTVALLLVASIWIAIHFQRRRLSSEKQNIRTSQST